MNTAGAFLSRKESTEEIGTGSFVTGTLTVKYLHPTPMDHPVILRAKVTDMREKKVIITCSVFSGEVECARGEVIAIRIPDGYWNE
jgi:acyl-CoA thioesterase FadM